jgi:hypothetical protein
MKRMTMLRRTLPILALATLGSAAWAQQSAAPAVESTLKTTTATVQGVYPKKRALTLVCADGHERSIFVGPDVKLGRLHAGDKVNVSYYQGIAAQLVKSGQEMSDPAAADFTYKNPKGALGGGAGSSVTVTVKILGVDPDTNTVDFRNPDGSKHIIAVRTPEMHNFLKTLKAGDDVDITYTDSVAVTVTPDKA